MSFGIRHVPAWKVLQNYFGILLFFGSLVEYSLLINTLAILGSWHDFISVGRSFQHLVIFGHMDHRFGPISRGILSK